jgi:hypothetical protein
MEQKYIDIIKKSIIDAPICEDLDINWINVAVKKDETRNLFVQPRFQLQVQH